MSNNDAQLSKNVQEEDDLDDLDDYLDEFQDEILSQPYDQGNTEQHKTTAQNTAATSSNDVDDGDIDDVLKKLAESSPEAKEIFESLMKDLTNAQDDENTPQQAQTENPKNLKDTISSTLNRLKESGPKVDQSIKDEQPDQMLNDLLKQLSLDGERGDNNLNDFDITNLLSELLDQLASKAVLYEPLKDLSVKYPEWIASNKTTITKEELKRFETQSSIVQSIVAKFELPDYDDSNQEYKSFINAQLEEMQMSGNPPKDLMGDLSKTGLPGFQFDSDDLPENLEADLEKDLEQNCAQQ